MPHGAKRTKMTEEEWWAGLDRELSQVLVGTNPADFVIPIALAVGAVAAFLLL